MCDSAATRAVRPGSSGSPRPLSPPLDRADATLVGRLLAGSDTSDVVDAHVVVCARRAGQAVLTSDPDDPLRLDPTLRVVTL